MAGQTRQQLNDPQVARLSGEFFQRTGDVATIAGTDAKPNNDGSGLARRFINQLGLAAWSAHFRPLETTGPGNGSLLNYAYQGAPLGGVPAAVLYNQADDYYGATATGAGVKHFLSRAIPNAAASWQGTAVTARICVGAITEFGLRFDDGTNNNWVELYATGVLFNGTYRIDFRYNDGGGAATVATGVLVPCSEFITVQLLCYWTGAQYQGFGLLVDETGSIVNLAGCNRTLTGNWAAGPPIAGRAGVMINNAGNRGWCDWFYNTMI